MPYFGMKRKVFISSYQGDRLAVDTFIRQWTVQDHVLIGKALGTYDNEDFINSNDREYVMGQIRKKYLADSTVTIVLLGACTHSRRYVDWELKTSLRQGDIYTPNGLFGILLPSAGGSAHLPERFAANWSKDDNCYARYYHYPSSASELGGWIDDAFIARRERANLIKNSTDLMKYNQKCRVCGVTH